jgi:hypothetical protein
MLLLAVSSVHLIMVTIVTILVLNIKTYIDINVYKITKITKQLDGYFSKIMSRNETIALKSILRQKKVNGH